MTSIAAPQADEQGAARFPALEGARGVAAWAVVAHHIMLMLSSDLHWAAMHCGDAAVAFFFVHSGFVLALVPMRTGIDVGPRAARRYLRLAPLVVASCLLTWAMLKLDLCWVDEAARLGASPWFASQYQFSAGIDDALREGAWSTFFGTGGERRSLLNPVLWTIGVEFVASILIFAFVAVFRTSRRARAVGYVIFLLCFPALAPFLAGVLMADLIIAWPGLFRPSTGLVAFALAGALFMQGEQYGTKFLVPAAISLVVAILGLSWLRWCLSRRLFVFFGRISFAIYVVHFPVLASVGAYAFSVTLNGAITAAAVVAATLVSATILERVVDRPGIALSKRLEAWLRADAVTSTKGPGSAAVGDVADVDAAA